MARPGHQRVGVGVVNGAFVLCLVMAILCAALYFPARNADREDGY